MSIATTPNKQQPKVTSLDSMHQDKLLGKLTMVDRLIFNGYLRHFFFRGSFKWFLCEQGVFLKDFGRYVRQATETVNRNAKEIAAERRRPYLYFRETVLGKDELAKQIAERDGIKEGLICVLATLELRNSFDVRGNRKTHHLEVVHRLRKCLHFYFYFIDPNFGLMHARIQSWFPFQIQVYVNGREWLARQLDRRGIGYRRYDNGLLQIDDLKTAKALAKRFARRNGLRVLNPIARRINPWLPRVQRITGRGYYWVIDECEVATDLMWRDRPTLAAIMPDLFDHAIRAFSAADVMRFLGRKLTGQFKGELVTDHKQRPEGRRVKHRIRQNWIKLYDKWSLLRVETTINNPKDFKVLRAFKDRRGRKYLQWVRMSKGVANLWRYIQVGERANERYLEALAHAPLKSKAVAELDELCQSRSLKGKRYPKLNPVSAQDCNVFQAALAGEHLIQGFRNRDLRRHLYEKAATSIQETKRRCARVSRLIVKLRGHQLVAKVPHSRLYRVTPRGQRLMSAALQYRQVGLPHDIPLAA